MGSNSHDPVLPRSQAKLNNIQVQAKMKKRYDAKHGQYRDFEMGDLVLVKRIQASGSSCKKFSNRFIGPFRVVERQSATTITW